MMDKNIERFIAKWTASGASERANKDLFLTELCDVLGVPHPNAATGDLDLDTYVFERKVYFPEEDGVVPTGRIDLFKDGCFLLEAKQGSSDRSKKVGTAKRSTAQWNIAMEAAYGQALGYAKCFDQPPPFLIICDIGHCFDLYCSFDGTTVYRPYNGTQGYRFYLSDLKKHADTLRRVITSPFELDTSKDAAKITRGVAAHLADLAKVLDGAGHAAGVVATFLMRCIFTMFAEDVGLLPDGIFKNAIKNEWLPHPEQFQSGIESLWECMNAGGKFGFVGKLLRFNGGLFRNSKALPLDRASLRTLLEAAKCNWGEVEPAIFGTLLEQALDPKERHRLGAHYTPRSYVERLVRPTIEEPLRAEWDVVRAEVAKIISTEVGDRVALSIADGAELSKAERKRIKSGNAGKKGAETSVLNRACEKVHSFHRKLCETHVLDPACGTGNFLYVTLSIFRQLEDEVLRMLAVLGEPQEMLRADRLRVTPAQFHGIEVKRWAKEIAELVLWIGYLQAHFRSYGRSMPVPEPVLQDYKNIEYRDAVLSWDRIESVVDVDGAVVTRWDGETMKESPVTGKMIPNEKARVPVKRYVNPRKADWPKADYIIGNPPYIGVRTARSILGDEYIEAIREAYPDVPETSDLVMFWWDKAAHAVGSGKARAFGLITTNSINQAYSRPLVEHHIGNGGNIALKYAVADHPWSRESDGAAVRIAMTVGIHKNNAGGAAIIGRVVSDLGDDEQVIVEQKSVERINSSLSIGQPTKSTGPLLANRDMCYQGVVPANEGFKLDADKLRSLGYRPDKMPSVVKKYVIGKDLVQSAQNRYIIDLFGYDCDVARAKWPKLYQQLVDYVFPERQQNKRASYREKWWLFAEPRPAMRKGLDGLSRFIVTPYTAKFRPFMFVSGDTIPDAMAYAIASDDAFILGVLSSKVHTSFALASGGSLEDRPRYNSKATFFPFPFPVCTELQRHRIRKLGEQIDAHRKERQQAQPTLTITGMYNVLEKIRHGIKLDAKDKEINDHGLVSLLKQLHDELDAAVLAAYGWPRNIADEQMFERLVALNSERAEEELQGRIRWLRPDFQTAEESKNKRRLVAAAVEEETVPPSGPMVAWPKTLGEQITSVRDRLALSGRVWSAAEMASRFKKAPRADVESVLNALASLGLVVAYVGVNGRRWMVPAPASSRMAA